MPSKYRIHNWFNTETERQEYGIQKHFQGRWCHLHENGKPQIYKSKDEAVEKMHVLAIGKEAGD